MSTELKQPKIIPCRKPAKEVSFGNPAGLARSHKIIRAVKAQEIQFMLVCSQIRLNEKIQARAEDQRNERRAKRQKENDTTIEIISD